VDETLGSKASFAFVGLLPGRLRHVQTATAIFKVS
jgi:hypothetical protein